MAKMRVHAIRVPDIPESVIDSAFARISASAIAMAVVRRPSGPTITCAGTLVVLNGINGILTARHVCEQIDGGYEFVIAIGSHTLEVSTKYLELKSIPGTRTLRALDGKVPDIAFVKLPLNVVSTIKAHGKVFYSIDRRVKSRGFGLFDRKGVWFVVGSPAVLAKGNPRAIPWFGYATQLSHISVQNPWDFAYVRMNWESNSHIPKDYGGMSGGGLWRARIVGDIRESRFWIDDPTRDVVLSGVVFAQTRLSGRQLVAHGPRSIYRQLPRLV